MSRPSRGSIPWLITHGLLALSDQHFQHSLHRFHLIGKLLDPHVGRRRPDRGRWRSNSGSFSRLSLLDHFTERLDQLFEPTRVIWQ